MTTSGGKTEGSVDFQIYDDFDKPDYSRLCRQDSAHDCGKDSKPRW